MKHIRAWQDRLTPAEQWRWAWTAAAALLSGLVWALLCRQVETQSPGAALAALGEAGLWLTGLFLGLLILAAALLLHSLFAGNVLVGAPVLVLSFANYFKLLITSTPLTVHDLSLIGQAGDIAALNSKSLFISPVSALTIAAGVVWLGACLFFSRPLRLTWKYSALGGLAAALVFALLFWAGADAVIYRPMGIGLEQNRPQAMVNAVCGTPLGLWRSVLNLGRRSDLPVLEVPPDLEELLDDPQKTPEPPRTAEPKETPAPVRTAELEETPDPGQTAGPEAAPEPTRTEPPPKELQHPNIIMILSESFFDITRLEGVSYARDPLPEFHALQAEGVSGRFYTRSLGYGTSSIELEIMTGLNTNLLGAEDLYSYPAETFSRVPAVPALLKENGYYTSMVHMFNDSIYHRSTLFRYLGFDDMYFSGDFAAIYPPAAQAEDYLAYIRSRISGTYYSDDFMSDILIAQYEKMSAGHDGPLFLYASSVEAHQPYSQDKYSPSRLTVEPVSSLTGEAATALLMYSQAEANASAALGKLVDYFRTVDEPTVIVFYGDHRPGLGLSTGGTVYSSLGIAPENIWTGSPEDFKELYSTDYLIWANDPSLLPGEPGSTWDTSCNYFGAAVLDLADVELPAYWQLIDRLAQTRVADMFFFYLDRAGNLSGEIAEDDPDAQRLATLRSIVSGVLAGGAAPE